MKNKKLFCLAAHIFIRPSLTVMCMSAAILITGSAYHNMAVADTLQYKDIYADESVVVNEMQDISLLKLGKFSHYEVSVIQKELDTSVEEHKSFCYLYATKKPELVPYKARLCYDYGFGYVSKITITERFPSDELMEDALDRLKSNLSSAGYGSTDTFSISSWWNFDDKKFLNYSNRANTAVVSYHGHRDGSEDNHYRYIEPAIVTTITNKAAEKYFEDKKNGVLRDFNETIYKKGVREKE